MSNEFNISDEQVYDRVKTHHWDYQQFSKWLETKLRIAEDASHSAGFNEGYRQCEDDLEGWLMAT